jgi:chaperone modulatory protein CbpM
MIMNRQEFVTCSGLQVQTLEFWLEQRWLIPQDTSAGMTFSDMDIARARLIQDLKTDFGVNDEGVDVILHLVDQIHGLRRALAQLHKDIQGDEAARGPVNQRQVDGGGARTSRKLWRSFAQIGRHREEGEAMKTTLPSLIHITAIILGFSAIASSFLAAGRYVMGATSNSVYILDRFTGDIRECSGGCESLTSRPKR